MLSQKSTMKDKYDEKEIRRYAFEGKDKLWLQKSHHYDVGFWAVFYNSYRCVIF